MMRRLIRKAARRDDQEQTTPPVPSAFAGSDIDTGDTIDGPPPIPFSPNAPPLYPGLDAVPNPV
ncbi:hypothetical protein, partial [Photobacterium swingsii]|uniref:hypothetical protein n=1 Tax=Photobacterium swingsii TaxID=680026 RepID=UPI0040686BEB